MNRMRRVVTAAIAAVAVAMLSGCGIVTFDSSAAAQSVPTASATAIPNPQGEIGDQLASLVIAAEGSNAGYSEELFPTWMWATEQYGWDPNTTNSNCDARWAALWRDGTGLIWWDQSKCVMDDTGYWVDRYGAVQDDGSIYYLQSESPSDFDIDHIVPKAAAWRSGASTWTADMRTRFANDPLNLQTASASVNRSKGDQSADTYLPPGEFRCEYADRYIEVKAKYNLTVTQPEHDRLAQTVTECGE